MKDEVRRFIRRHALLPEHAPVLVAVSGGVDSIVLLDLLRDLGHPCTVAHVDHGLRGAESAADSAFVQEHCDRLGVPCVAVLVDVRAHVGGGTSVQMAARELRYQALKAIALGRGLPAVALAHHRDDAIETFLLELMRGGLGTIPVRSGTFVRPLLGVGRAAIEAHARAQGLRWREDPTNHAPTYLRNRVRHELLPLLESLSPGVRRVLGRSLERLRAQADIAQGEVRRVLNDQGDALPLDLVRDRDRGALLLHHWLRPLGFHPDQLDGLRDAVEQGHVGATFLAGDHRVTVDREALLRNGVGHPPLQDFEVGPDLRVPAGAPFRIERCDASAIDLGQGPCVAWIDADRCAFPLRFGPWRHGDRMRPMGLDGTKLVSDILTDAHVPRPRKERTWVMRAGADVAWLVGYRIAEGLAATQASRSVLRVECLAP